MLMMIQHDTLECTVLVIRTVERSCFASSFLVGRGLGVDDAHRNSVTYQ